MNTFAPAGRRLRASLRTHRKRWILITAPVAVVALLALVTYLVWPQLTDPAAATIRDYLTAIRDGDASRARELAEGDDGTSAVDDEASTRFLADDALGAEWSIDTVKSTGEVTADTLTAYVKTTISTPDGERATHTFQVHNNDDGSWDIIDPYVTAVFSPSLVPYVDVNGAKKNITGYEAPEDHVSEATFLLFPGAYRFYESVPKVIDYDAPTIPLLTGNLNVGFGGDDVSYGVNPVKLPAMTLTKSGQKTAQKLVNDYIDDCAKKTKALTPGCPFGAEYVLIPDKPGYAYDEDSVKNVKWKVIDYPVITAVHDATVFAISDRQRGTVKLTATGTEDGVTATSTAECEIIDTEFNLEITKKGKLRLFPEGGRTDLDDVDPDGLRWSTCPD
ncbi:hypothetical protein [Stackebrandtia nassauensis]|uniref:DUF4878 domain-containing protein n=1 Tax=Stackebrandtia nassauensis (strain DSM 44728 / CIP 108903 / NRRL B-16338 / NBRC 102104 / LLR-40K-21) TaxID=446470 RepID=D3Q094_STANL|nr:hypothetical protein [Stackebrandtia nassauensis]ADD45623.1 hypothetical protein Snas_5997 [Stackebrandtia nassauensis DSM 44728]